MPKPITSSGIWASTTPLDYFENHSLNIFTTNLVLVKGTELAGDLKFFIQQQTRFGTDKNSGNVPHIYLFVLS